ncbi:MAG: guanine deaminase [Pseudomonadota bacterium]
MAKNFLRGPTLSFSSKPADENSPGIDYFEDGVLIIQDGIIENVLDAQAFEREGGDLQSCEHLTDSLILPGLIDTHIHYPQMDMIASYGSQLLEWLEKYAFPAEVAFASAEHAQLKSEAFLDRLAANGTTSALVYTTVHAVSTEALFAAADARNIRLITGKVMMDRNAPDNLRDHDDGIADSIELIERWHGQGRLSYAVTPRFAVTCSHQQMTRSGELLERYPGIYLHTHMSEHPDEISATLELFPDAPHYVDVYDRYGMINERSVFAHGIHLSDEELTRLSEAGACIAFCPSSNMFLGSGLLDLARLEEFGVTMSVATDVGAGTSFSMLATLGDGYKVAQLRGQSWHPMKAFHAATLGNAEALGLGDKIGRLAAGYEADITVLQPTPGSVLADRLTNTKTLTEQLFAYMTLGAEDAVARCYIDGKLAYKAE